MTDPQTRPAPKVKIGVRLDRAPEDLSAWLTDASAFDAAGAEALWVDLAARPGLDPLALTAALAAVTYRARLVTRLPRPDAMTAAALATVGRLSHGRLMIITDEGTGAEASWAAGIEPVPGLFHQVAGNEPGTEEGDSEVFEHFPEIADETPEGTDSAERAQRLVSVTLPDSRVAWQATLQDVARREFYGLVVPADPRLVDILRNPDELDDRQDLQLSVG